MSEGAIFRNGTDFLQRLYGLKEPILVGGCHEWEFLWVMYTKGDHSQDGFGEVGYTDFRKRVFRPVFAVLFAVQAVTDTGSRTACPTLPLVCRGAGNCLKVQ